jgi:formylglycine-generating enzyme required for sulfatase activity
VTRSSAVAALVATACLVAASLVDCSRDDDKRASVRGAPSASATEQPPAEQPELLYLPDGGDLAPPSAPAAPTAPVALGPSRGTGRCPADMVDIQGRFCIDRFEDVLVDARSERELSPYYPPVRELVAHLSGLWQKRWPTSATAEGQKLAPPAPPDWQLAEAFEPRAVARQGVVPNGYVSGLVAERACANAGKRLCKLEEWMLACRGERGLKFPYGDSYEEGQCNVFREAHPARVLHGNASINHLDPRLNLVAVAGRPLLRRTGATPTCRSAWGGDGVYDMVGNLDEWVDEPKGMFAGGFYSRGTREGCDSRIASHPREYYDYSLGVRCCR